MARPKGISERSVHDVDTQIARSARYERALVLRVKNAGVMMIPDEDLPRHVGPSCWYLLLGAIPESARADALHVAVAVVHEVEAVISWNLRHLVRLRTRRAVNAVNALRGYRPVEILTPPEL
jgi:hypothetical protein